MMVYKLSTIIKGALEKVSGEKNKIKYPPEYYEQTGNLKENLCKYKVAIKEIKAKYEPFLLKAENDKKGQVLQNKSVLKYEQEINQKIREELDYARLLTHYRQGDVTAPGLNILIRFAERNDSPKRVEEFKKELRILRGRDKLIYAKNLVRGEIIEDLMRDINYNVKPAGKSAEYPLDWQKKLERLMNELEKNSLSLDDEGHDDKIRAIWHDISQEAEESFRATLKERELEAKETAIQTSQQEVSPKIRRRSLDSVQDR